MEQVFVADRAAFFGGAWPQGFVPLAGPAASTFLRRVESAGRFEPRASAEEQPAWKQWIPYCVVRCTGPGADRPDDRPLAGVFRVRRSARQSESRLHGKWSIGLGGHVNPSDTTGSGGDHRGIVQRALWRELYEELHLDLTEKFAAQLLGVLNDDSTAVGSVHAGIVYALDLTVPLAAAEKLVSIREISKMSGGWGSLAELFNLWQDPSQFETWSQILIRAGVVGPMASSVTQSAHPGGTALQGEG